MATKNLLWPFGAKINWKAVSLGINFLFPIQTGRGGGRILPARTLDVYNFFNKQANATELGDFP